LRFRFQEATPLRVRGVHYVNPPKFVSRLVNFFKLFMPSKIQNRVNINSVPTERNSRLACVYLNWLYWLFWTFCFRLSFTRPTIHFTNTFQRVCYRTSTAVQRAVLRNSKVNHFINVRPDYWPCDRNNFNTYTAITSWYPSSGSDWPKGSGRNFPWTQNTIIGLFTGYYSSTWKICWIINMFLLISISNHDIWQRKIGKKHFIMHPSKKHTYRNMLYE